MFRKNSNSSTQNNKPQANKPASRNTEILSVIAKDTHLLGTVLSEGSIDFDGTLDGNIRSHILTVRKNGTIKGDVTVDILHVYGKIDGLVRARHVHLHKDCHVEGIIMHETLVIEDGAFMDGKCKRTDRSASSNHDDDNDIFATASTISSGIRLIN